MRHNIAVNAADSMRLVCDCGTVCEDLDAWHLHTVRLYNNPSPQAIELRGTRVHDAIVTIEAARGGMLAPCRKVGCGNQANNRECWTLKPAGRPRLFELPSREIAVGLSVRGGVLSRTYELSTC